MMRVLHVLLCWAGGNGSRWVPQRFAMWVWDHLCLRFPDD